MSDAYEAMKRLQEQRTQSEALAASQLHAQTVQQLAIQRRRLGELAAILAAEQVPNWPVYRLVSKREKWKRIVYTYEYTQTVGWYMAAAHVGLCSCSPVSNSEYLRLDSGMFLDSYAALHHIATTRSDQSGSSFSKADQVIGLTHGQGFALNDTGCQGLLYTAAEQYKGPVNPLGGLSEADVPAYYLKLIDDIRNSHYGRP